MRTSPCARIFTPGLLCLVFAACGQQAPGDSSDWVISGARIYTADRNQPWAEAVVIRNGVFAYVGNNEGAEAFATDSATVTDVDGRLVIPGLVDAHTHPGQIELIQHDTTFSAETRSDFIAELENFAASNQDEDWVRACCWPVQEFVAGDKGPDRQVLDRIFPDRPVWISSSAGHSFWLNGRALRELGLDEDSKDPRFPVAMYKRDETGRLTGWVKEGAGWQLMDEVFEVDAARHEAGMRAMLQTLSEHGVTTLYDAGTKEFSDRVYAFLAGLEKAGELPLRYEGTYRISTPDRRMLAIEEMKRFRETWGGERLQFNTIKLFMDGIYENRSGAVIESYADNPDFVSGTTLTVEELRDYLIELHRERFDLHVHVIGDLATESVLDAVEQAKAAVGESFYPRVSLGHLQTVAEKDWARIASLGVSANFTPWWLGFDDPDPVGEGLGPARDNDTYRVRAIADAGGNVTFSSDDWTLEVLSPFLGMQVGHTRQYPREWLTDAQDPDAFRQPESEKLPLELLLDGYTINGAYQLRMEDRIGSIEVGKAADLVILGEDLFDIDPYRLHTVRPDAVLMEGELVQGELSRPAPE